jgi:hypothetical protein
MRMSGNDRCCRLDISAQYLRMKYTIVNTNSAMAQSCDVTFRKPLFLVRSELISSFIINAGGNHSSEMCRICVTCVSLITGRPGISARAGHHAVFDIHNVIHRSRDLKLACTRLIRRNKRRQKHAAVVNFDINRRRTRILYR